MGILIFYPAAEAGKRTWLELNLGHGVPGYAVGWFGEEEMKKRMEMWLLSPGGKGALPPLPLAPAGARDPASGTGSPSTGPPPSPPSNGRTAVGMPQRMPDKSRIQAHPVWKDFEAARPFALNMGGDGSVEMSELYSLARKLVREQEAQLLSGAPPVVHRP